MSRSQALLILLWRSEAGSAFAHLASPHCREHTIIQVCCQESKDHF